MAIAIKLVRCGVMDTSILSWLENKLLFRVLSDAAKGKFLTPGRQWKAITVRGFLSDGCSWDYILFNICVKQVIWNCIRYALVALVTEDKKAPRPVPQSLPEVICLPNWAGLFNWFWNYGQDTINLLAEFFGKFLFAFSDDTASAFIGLATFPSWYLRRTKFLFELVVPVPGENKKEVCWYLRATPVGNRRYCATQLVRRWKGPARFFFGHGLDHDDVWPHQ